MGTRNCKYLKLGIGIGNISIADARLRLQILNFLVPCLQSSQRLPHFCFCGLLCRPHISQLHLGGRQHGFHISMLYNKLRFRQLEYDTSKCSSQGFSWSPSNRYLDRSKLASTRLCNNHIIMLDAKWILSQPISFLG